MPFDFSKIPGIDPELSAKLNADAAAQSAVVDIMAPEIESAVANRVEVAKTDFKTKMDALNVKLTAANERLQNVPEVTADELKALRQQAEANPELTATLEALKTKSTSDAEALTKANDTISTMRLSQTVTSAINKFNTDNPTVAVKSDMVDVVTMLANQSLKVDPESGDVRVVDSNGGILATDKGAATPVDWLGMLRNDRPSLFAAPSGGGASGQNSGGAQNSITRAQFDALNPVDQAATVKGGTAVVD